MTSETPVGQPDELKSALLEYSKAVIKSGMDCEYGQAQSLEANIITTRKKMIATHEATVNQLETSRANWRREKRQLEEKVTTFKQEKKGFEGELRGMRTAEAEMKEQSVKDNQDVQKYKRLWEKGLTDVKKLETENTQLKKESRKRRRVEEIWERAEKVKMD